MISFGEPPKTRYALSRHVESSLCVIENACCWRACHGRPRDMELFARSATVSTALRLTTADDSCNKERRSNLSIVDNVSAERWSYSGSLWSEDERKRRRRSKTNEKERICKYSSEIPSSYIRFRQTTSVSADIANCASASRYNCGVCARRSFTAFSALHTGQRLFGYLSNWYLTLL